MKPTTTTIDVQEIVDAFRAQEQERLDRESAERRHRLQQIVDNRDKCRWALQAIIKPLWPAVLALPHGKFNADAFGDPVIFDTDHAAVFIEFSTVATAYLYPVDRKLEVWWRPHSQSVMFTLKHGKRGGCLLDPVGKRHPLGHETYENPADLIVRIAEWAGICKARQPKEWS
jgi:hypothetical protein